MDTKKSGLSDGPLWQILKVERNRVAYVVSHFGRLAGEEQGKWPTQ
ncbi:MAG TPA: hypothetical protein PLR48_06380 [Bacillota bacterium]|nr:hypothetical protein [Bacillota bacterium]